MQALIGWPSHTIAIVLASALAAALLIFVVLALRSSILFKLGVRNVPRRRARAILIIFGLMLSTTVIGSALSTGDSMTHTVRSLVSESLGPVDEVVVAGPTSDGNGNRVSDLTQPGINQLASARFSYFDSTQADEIGKSVHDSRAIAGVMPAIVEQVTAVQPETHQAQALLTLLALPESSPPAFGTMTTRDGTPLRLDALAPDEVVMNEAAALVFGATPGQSLRLMLDEQSWNVRLAAVVTNSGLGGLEPAVIAPLGQVQRVTGHAGQVNLLLVANHGGVDSVKQSAAASEALRLPLADHAAAQEIYAFLHTPEVQHALLDASGQVYGADRTRLLTIRAEAARPTMTNRFVSLVTDPQTRRQLFQLGFSIPSSSADRSIFEQLRTVTDFSVLEVKQESLVRANEYGAVVTTVFLVLGLFSVAAGVLLVFLIFSLLATDRGPELATMRALGMSRGQIVSMFLFDGLIYNLLAALLGGVAGFAVSYLTTRSLEAALATFGFHLDWHVEPLTLVITFASGVLLILLIMFASAWRASRSGIAGATHGDDTDENRSWLLIPGTLLMLGGLLVWWHWRVPTLPAVPRNPLVLPGALSLELLGAAIVVTGITAMAGRSLRPRWAARVEQFALLLTTLIGLGLFGLWLRTLAELPTPRGSTIADALAVAGGGLVLVLTATWLVMRLLRPALALLDRALSALGRLRSIVRPAAGYLGDRPWRTGFAVVMFGIVIFTMVTALTMINALIVAYSPSSPPIAGFDIRADQAGPTPITNMTTALSTASAVSPNAFRGIGSITALSDAEVVQLGVPRASWQPAPLAIVNNQFLTNTHVALSPRIPTLRGDAIWWAVRDQPGTAVVSSTLLNSVLTLPETTANDDGTFTLWVRPHDGGQPVRLAVIGLVDSRSELDPGIYISQQTAQGFGIALDAPTTYLFAVKEGVRPVNAAEGLRISFTQDGLSVSNLSDKAQVGRSIRLLLTRIVQGFMGLGLIAGVAALGMLGVQSVIERRVQLGTLRALGFTRWQTRATLAFEAAVTAALGIGLGIALGLVMARTLVRIIALEHPEVHFLVPWEQIALTAAVAVAGSILSVTIAVWQAGRVSPADALRAG
jgi:putative ABC transport system permease protein